MPERIQLKRTKGWKMPPNTVKVARPGIFGNPYTVEKYGVELALKLYRETVQGCWNPALILHMTEDESAVVYNLHCDWLACFRAKSSDIRELRGKNLACFCPLDSPCHADLLLELANKGADGHAD